jgi:ubiquinone/menaquinone biosynthesis C-methylase UbiE
MAWQGTHLREDLRLVRSKDVAEWYGEVVTAWDSLLSTPERWRNLGYWDGTTTDLAQACRALAAKLADAALVGPGDDVLDVGCGLGESTLYLRERLGDSPSRLVGMDLTHAHVASGRARRRGPRPEFVVGSATDLPFPDASFDRVLALECAFHFPDRRRFFAEAARVLRPGGVLGVADVLVEPWFARMLRRADRVVPAAVGRPLHRLGADVLKMPTENLVDLDEYLTQLATAGLLTLSTEDISDRVFPHFKRHWQRSQDHARQEELLVAAGTPPAAAPARARAWRRQMRVLMLGWRSSRFVIVTARRPADGRTGAER